MGKKLLFFNVIYYGITIFLMTQLTDRGGGSLGTIILMMIFWGVALILLIILLATKTVLLKSVVDKVGVFLATPVVSIIYLTFLYPSQESKPFCTEEYFEQNNHRYLKKTCDDDNGIGKIVEYYLSFDSVNNETNSPREIIVKDSTWVYLTQNGDTIKTLKYKNGVEIK